MVRPQLPLTVTIILVLTTGCLIRRITTELIKQQFDDCEGLQAYLSEGFFVENIIPSYAPGGCTFGSFIPQGYSAARIQAALLCRTINAARLQKMPHCYYIELLPRLSMYTRTSVHHHDNIATYCSVSSVGHQFRHCHVFSANLVVALVSRPSGLPESRFVCIVEEMR
jgi:hypothetical protein